VQQLHEQVHGVVVGEVGGEVHGAGVRLGLRGSYWASGVGGREDLLIASTQASDRPRFFLTRDTSI
jgi:hypothetical protein